MSQIKSVSINDESNKLTYTFYDWKFIFQEDGYVKIVSKNRNQTTFWYPIENCKVEYQKPQILKRPDGSLIRAEKGTLVVVIDYGFYLANLVYNHSSISLSERLKEGRVFLIQDAPLAEKKAKQLTKQLEIQFEIDRLNALDIKAKNHIIWRFEKANIISSLEFDDRISRNTPENKKMSEKTAEKILAKYSQQDLNQYLRTIEPKSAYSALSAYESNVKFD